MSNVGKVFNLSGGGGSGSPKMESLTIATTPNKTVYKSGETFDPTGMVVVANYGEGLMANVTGYTVSPSVLTDGVSEVVITYTEGRITKTATVAVTVKKVLISIAITTQPAKTVYQYQESLDPTGMVVTATFSDGSTAAVLDYTYPTTNFSTLGRQVMKLEYTYEGVTKSTDLVVTVQGKTIAVPTQTNIPTYNGSDKTPSWNGYDPLKMEISGVTSASDAGSYTAIFKLSYGYLFPDGTDEARVKWTIGKAVNSVTNSPSSIVLKSSAKTATFTVNRKGNGTITATSNNTSVAKIKSINQNTGVVTVESVNDTTGMAKITVKVAEGTNYKAASDTTVNVTATFVTIYGVEWDWTSSGQTRGKRTDAAAGFAEPNPAVNNGGGSSPFDNLMPWSGMVKETRSGGVEVKEPKYWFKWTKTGKKLKLQIADGYVEGFSVDPVNRDRGDGLGELDYSYIGRYHCASGYKSTTGAAQQVNITRSQARSGIHNLGANFWQMDFAQFWYVNMLFLVEFADWNGERIGRGCSTSNSKMNNGQTDAMGYHTGTTAASRDSYGFTQYRNIEGWWDNVYDWMDGCYYNNNGLNVISNPNNFSDSANGTLVGTPSSGYPSDFTIPTASGLEWALFPSAANGSQTTYVPDYWFFNGGYPCLCHGGNASQSRDRGPFYINYHNASNASGYIGCRLQERPPKAA